MLLPIKAAPIVTTAAVKPAATSMPALTSFRPAAPAPAPIVSVPMLAPVKAAPAPAPAPVPQLVPLRPAPAHTPVLVAPQLPPTLSGAASAVSSAVSSVKAAATSLGQTIGLLPPSPVPLGVAATGAASSFAPPSPSTPSSANTQSGGLLSFGGPSLVQNSGPPASTPVPPLVPIVAGSDSNGNPITAPAPAPSVGAQQSQSLVGSIGQALGLTGGSPASSPAGPSPFGGFVPSGLSGTSMSGGGGGGGAVESSDGSTYLPSPSYDDYGNPSDTVNSPQPAPAAAPAGMSKTTKAVLAFGATVVGVIVAKKIDLFG